MDQIEYGSQSGSTERNEQGSIPIWARRGVDVDSVKLRNLPIGWIALRQLGRSLSAIADQSMNGNELDGIKLPHDLYLIVPMIASIVAHHHTPDIPVNLPTQNEIIQMKPWLGNVQRFIGRFSQTQATKFGRHIEQKGQRVVEDAGYRISTFADRIRSVENPQQQFVRELTHIYNDMAKPDYVIQEDLFGEYVEPITIEEKFDILFRNLRDVRDGKPSTSFTRDKYPLLTTVLPMVGFPPDTMDYERARIAGAELMEGIHTFLQRRGVTSLEDVPQPQEFNFFDLTTYSRGIAEQYFGERLEKVKRDFPTILAQVYDVLPNNGPALSDAIYRLSEDISVLHALGQTPDDLVHMLFRA